MNFKVLALVLVSVEFVYRLVIDYLNWKSMKNPLPATVANVFDAAEYQKWKEYHEEKAKLGLFSSVVTFVVSLLALGLNWYAAFAGLFPDHPIW